MTKKEKTICNDLLGNNPAQLLQKLTSLYDEGNKEFKKFWGFSNNEAIKALEKLVKELNK